MRVWCSCKVGRCTIWEGFKCAKGSCEGVVPDASTRPKVLGPAGFYEENWFNTFLETIGPEVVDGVTHHLYNLGSVISIYVSKLRSLANNSFKSKKKKL